MLTIATAKRTRWVWPPESLLVFRSAMSEMPASSSVSSTVSGVGYSEPIMSISSRTLRSPRTAPVCSIAPIAPLAIASAGVIPNTCTSPASGLDRPSNMSIVVDLPAPLGPSSATVSPGEISMSIPRTACTGPAGDRNVLVSPTMETPLICCS